MQRTTRSRPRRLALGSRTLFLVCAGLSTALFHCSDDELGQPEVDAGTAADAARDSAVADSRVDTGAGGAAADATVDHAATGGSSGGTSDASTSDVVTADVNPPTADAKTDVTADVVVADAADVNAPATDASDAAAAVEAGADADAAADADADADPLPALQLCTFLDQQVGIATNVAGCDTKTDSTCPDRASGWAGFIADEVTVGLFADCRIVGELATLTNDEFTAFTNEFVPWTYAIMGCPDPAVTARTFALVPAKLSSYVMTTADLQALTEVYMKALSTALTDDIGIDDLTADKKATVQAVLAWRARHYQGNFVTADNYSFGLCTSEDGGAEAGPDSDGGVDAGTD